MEQIDKDIQKRKLKAIFGRAALGAAAVGSVAMLPVGFSLAALGLTTLAAFVLMGLMGLVTEWSFRRIFVTSFLLGLAAPLIAAISLGQAAERALDGRDLRDVIAQNIEGGEERLREWEQAGEQAQEIIDSAERGEISEQEAERQLEQLIEEQTGFEVDLEDVQIDQQEGGVRIETQ